MKKLSMTYNDHQYQIYLYLEGCGLCDVTLYRERLVKRWWQSKFESIKSFTCYPRTMEDLYDRINFEIKEYEETEASNKCFFDQYQKLEDVKFL